MSQTVDRRVVEMRFDNKQFESGAKTSMNTLSRLKEALKLPESGKSLDNIGKASRGVKLDGLISGVETLEKRFSTLGVVGMRVIENITDGLMNKINSAVSAVSNSIISGGIKRAMNIENAHFQLQALLKDETKVQAVMADAMESVDGTAYAYDEAAKAASQFAASGVQSGEEMLNALKGITGVAAMTNSSFEDVSRIFTTVAGQGRLMGDQLMQLASRGLNAPSTIANWFKEVRGEAEMTEATVRELVSDGAISFKIFIDAMTWAFGDSAKRANETFTGSLSNIKSALARIGAGFVSPLVEQNGEVVKMFNAIRIKTNEVKSALVFDEQRSAIAGLADTTKMSKDELTAMFNTIKENGSVSYKELDSLSEKGANSTLALQKYMNGVVQGSTRSSYAIKTALQEMAKELILGDSSLKAMVDSGEKNLDDLVDAFVFTEADVKKFVTQGKIDLNTFTAAMEKEFGTEKRLSKHFTDWVQDYVHAITTALTNADLSKPMEAFNNTVDSAINLAKGLLSVLNPIGKAFQESFSFINVDKINSLSKNIAILTSKMRLSEKESKNLHDIFKGLFDVSVLLGRGFVKVLTALFPITGMVKELSGGFLDVGGSIGRALSEFSRMIQDSERVEKVFEKIHSGTTTLSSSLIEAIAKVKDFIKTIKKLPGIQSAMSGVSDFFDNIGMKAEKRLSPLTDIIKTIFGILKKVGPVVLSIIDKLSDSIAALLKHISDAVGTGEVSAIGDLLNIVLSISIWKKLSEFIKSLTATTKSVKGFINSIKRIFSNVTSTLKEMQRSLKAETLKSIAVSVALIAGSILVLSLIDSNKLTESLAAVSVLIGELTGVFILLNKIDKNKKGSISGTRYLIAMSASVMVLALALKKVSGIDSDKLLGSLGAITVLLTEMTLVSIVLSKYGGKVNTGIVGIIAFSTAIYILSSSVKKLGELDVDTLIKGLSSIAALLTELSLFMIASKFGNFKLSQGASILILSAALLILQKSVESFGTLDFEVLRNGLIAIGAILTEISVFSLVSGKSSHMLETSVSLVIIAKAIGMLQKPLSDFGNMSLEEIGRGLLAIGVALGEITIAMRLIPKNALSIGTSLLVVAGSLTIIGKVVTSMGSMSWDEIVRGLVTLGGSLVILSVAMKAMKGTANASAAMLIMATSLAILTPVLKSLGSMSWDEIVRGLVVLAGAFTVIGVSAYVLSPVITAILGLSGAIALLGVAAFTVGAGVLALSVGLTTLAASGVAGAAALVEVIKILMVGVLDAISDSATAIGNVIKTLILVACDVIVSCVPEVVKTVLVVIKEVLTALADNIPEIGTQIFRIIIGIIDAIAENLPELIQSVMNLFSKIFESIGQALNGVDAESLSEIITNIGTLTLIMLALAGLSMLASSAITGILAFGLMIAELSIVLAAIGGLAQIPGLTWIVNEGGVLLEGVGTAIGKFIGGIVSGSLSTISSSLPQIGSDLSDFMINLGPFIIGSKMIDAESLACVGFLAGIITALTAAEVVNGLASLFGLSLSDLAIELSNFMTKLEPFITGSKNISKDSMQACSYLGDMIVSLTKANVVNGIGRIFGLSGSLADFGAELVAFGPSISEFADAVKDVKPEAVEGAAAAAEIMASVADKLPAQEGWVQKIFGSKSLADFGAELVSFGPSIKQFSEIVKDIKPEAVEGAAAAAEIMADLADTLPAQEGLVQKIFGNKSLADFGAELVAFGPKIWRFASIVEGISKSSVLGAASVTGIMSELANDLPDSDSLWNKIFGGGKISLSEFGAELVQFGTLMSGFSSSISGIKAEDIKNTVSSFRELIDLASYVKGVSASDLIKFSKQLANVEVDAVDKFYNVGENVVLEFVKGLENRTPASITAIENFAESIVETFQTSLSSSTINLIGQNVVNGFSAGIDAKRVSVMSNIDALCLSIKSRFSIGLVSSAFTARGANLVAWLIQGINSKRPYLKTPIVNICNTVVDEFKKNLTRAKLKSIGANAALGLKDGIESKIDAIAQAAIAAAKKAVDEAKKALDEHSPSKVMAKVGEFFSVGFANGILSQLKAIGLAGARVTDEAINPVKDAVDIISDIVNSGSFDIDPVITPVVDLSGVQRGAREIESLMSRRYDLSDVRDRILDTSYSFEGKKTHKIESGKPGTVETVGNTYEFIQNNYSPKALSRSEIYRQTNNQFSEFKKAVNPV